MGGSGFRNRLRVRKALLLAGAVGVAATVLLLPLGPVLRAEQQPPIPASVAACAACHADAAAGWAKSLHRRTVGAPQIPESRQGCDACHAGSQQHLADVSNPAYRPGLGKLTGKQISDLCSRCHRGGKQALWQLSAHARIKDSCLACHDPHGGVGTHMLKAEEPELCQGCHPQAVAEGRLPSHHPIQEGKMVCTDCHNVHGDQRGNLAEASNGEMCFRCHPDIQGPFLAEHPPVTEDCTICHRPHGSPVDNLLVQDQPMLCLQCHPGHSSDETALVPATLTPAGIADARQAIFAFYAKCTSCHSRIHGSDLLSGTGSPTFMSGSPLVPLGRQLSIASMGATTADRDAWGFSDIDLGRISQSNNQSFVREWDGRDYNVPAASRLSISKYGQQDDFRMDLNGYPRGDEDANLRMGNPRYDLQFKLSGLTHRLGRFDDPSNTFLVASDGTTDPVVATDRSNGKNDFQLNRTLVDARLAARCPKMGNAKFLFNYWQDSRTGSRQFLFLERCDGCHKIQTTEPVDWINTITESGVQVDFPKSSIRYLRGQEEFSNRAPEELNSFPGITTPEESVLNGVAPLFGVASTKASTNDLRAAGQLSDRVSLAGLWRTKERQDLLGGANLNVSSTGGGASYLVSPHLALQVSHYQRRLDADNDLLEGISRHRDTTRADLSLTALRNTILSVGFAKEKVDRQDQRDLLPARSDSDIWSSTLSSRPLSRLSLLVRYRGTRTDNTDFFDPLNPPAQFPSRLPSLPNQGRLLTGVLGYDLNPKTLLSAMYTRQRDSFDVQVPELGVFHAAENTVKTKGVQLLRNQGRGRLSAGYFRQDGDTGSNVNYGTDNFHLVPPLSTTDILFTPFSSTAASHYRATIENLDGSLWGTSRLRLFGRLSRARTSGVQTLNDLGDYLDQNPDLNGVAITINPFDIDIRDWWLGAGYLLDPRTEVVLSYQRRSWTDNANTSHDGSYKLWRVGVRKQF